MNKALPATTAIRNALRDTTHSNFVSGYYMSGIWKHKATIIDGQTFKLKELNIWDYQWEDTGNSIQIKDPMYGKDYKLNIYRIVKENIKIQFAAGEFSNCVWGIYLEST